MIAHLLLCRCPETTLVLSRRSDRSWRGALGAGLSSIDSSLDGIQLSQLARQARTERKLREHPEILQDHGSTVRLCPRHKQGRSDRLLSYACEEGCAIGSPCREDLESRVR